jgi:repressor LexA
LVSVGLVYPMEGLHRGIRLTEEPSGTTRSIPWLGHIAAGRPIEALSQNEYLEIPAMLAAVGDCYALKVRGDSMIEAGILDGDWVIIEHRSHARDGEIVVALVDGEEATLKRIRQGRDQVTLLPANSGMEALQYSPDRVRIQGVLVGQMRTYR